jgi:xanthine dehydrogenase accessory factor
MKSIYDEIAQAIENRRSAVLCIVTSVKGSTPRKQGAKMIVYENSEIFGTIGGGDLEKKVIENALEVLKTHKPVVFKHDLLHQHGMCCGGTVEIYIEPIMNRKKLYIFGSGHTGQALAKFAVNFEFDIFVIDERKEYLDVLAVDGINKMNLEHDKALRTLPFDNDVFIVIVTHSHQIDRDILAYCIKKPFAYLGMIGSERKVKVTKKMFIDGKIGTLDELEKVHMPIGMGISAETPEEIAISILGELIKVKNRVLNV